MTKTVVKAKYDSASRAATATLAVGAGDLKLKASCSDGTFSGTPSLHGVSLGVEKPGAFLIDYDLHQQAARFQFMTGATVAGKGVRLTYIHPQKRNATFVEGSLALDSRNKVTGTYSFAAESGQLKYTYNHSSGTTMEPGFDFGTKAWHFSIARKFAAQDNVKAFFDGHHKTVGLEWARDAKDQGPFKVTATVHVSGNKPPKVVAEKTWSCEF